MHSSLSSYSIWGEESPPRTPLESYLDQPTEQQQQQQSVQHHIPAPGDASEYSIWGEQQLQQQLTQQQQQHQWQQQRPDSPSIVVRVKDGEQVLSEVFSSSGGSSNGAGVAETADKAVQAGEPSLTDPQQQQQQQQEKEKEEEEVQQKPWWSPVVFWLPGQKPGAAADAAAAAGPGSQQQLAKQQQGSKAAAAGEAAAAEEEPNADLHAQEPLSSAQRAWWQPLIDNDFVRSLPGMPNAGKDSKAAQQQLDDAAAELQQQQQQQQHGPENQAPQKQWWEDLAAWLPRPTGSIDLPGGASDGAADGRQPVEAIVIPADLPLEEIAKEVAKLKEDAWRSKEDHLENLWAKTVERNDRSWLMLLCFLLSVVIGLLCVVAWRISGLEGAPDEAANAAAAAAGAGQLPVAALLGVVAAAMVHFGM
jgi:hypothetical protein